MDPCNALDCAESAAGGYDVCERHLLELALITCQRMSLRLREVELTPQRSDEDAIRTGLHGNLCCGY